MRKGSASPLAFGLQGTSTSRIPKSLTPNPTNPPPPRGRGEGAVWGLTVHLYDAPAPEISSRNARRRTAALHGKRRFSLVARPSQSSPDPSGSETERSQAEFWFWIIATSVGSATNAPAITAAA